MYVDSYYSYNEGIYMPVLHVHVYVHEWQQSYEVNITTII